MLAFQKVMCQTLRSWGAAGNRSEPMKGLQSGIVIFGLLLLAASGCGESATSPAPHPEPPRPPTAGPPARPTSPLNYASIVGVYDLAETVTDFDPAWGDITGHRFTAVLTLAQGVGTFSDLRFLNAEGKTVEGPPRDGSVTWATWAQPDTLVLDLGRNHNLIITQIDESDNGRGRRDLRAGSTWLFTSAGRSSPRAESRRRQQSPSRTLRSSRPELLGRAA